jgi:hypothetical protein
MNRRSFNRNVLFLILGAFTAPFAMTGCNAFADIAAWIPVATTAIQGILSLVTPFINPAATAAINLALAALASLGGAITEYNNDTNVADKATLLAKIRTFLSDVGTNIQSFLNALNIGGNPIVTVVLGLAQILLAAIAGFLGQLPTTAGANTKVLSTTVTAGGTTLPVAPKLYKNVKDFKRDFNAVAIANYHPEIEIY